MHPGGIEALIACVALGGGTEGGADPLGVLLGPSWGAFGQHLGPQSPGKAPRGPQEASRGPTNGHQRGPHRITRQAGGGRLACMSSWRPQQVIQLEGVHGRLEVQQPTIRWNNASIRRIHPRTLHWQAKVLSMALAPSDLIAHRRIPTLHGLDGRLAGLPLMRSAHQLENILQKTARWPQSS